jgi:hypothetical protein
MLHHNDRDQHLLRSALTEALRVRVKTNGPCADPDIPPGPPPKVVSAVTTDSSILHTIVDKLTVRKLRSQAHGYA